MLVPPVLLVAAAVAVGLLRPVRYTANARLVVGGTNVNRANVLATGGSAEALTGVFGRALNARGVVDPVSRQVGMKRSEVAARLSGSPVPKSTLVLITAEGKSPRQAVRLANAASGSLITYANTLTSASSEQLAGQLKKASFELTRTKRDQRRLQSSRRPRGSGLLDAANANVQVAELRVRSLRSAYQSDQSSASGQNVLQSFDTAVGATSDRRSTLQLLIVAALIAGVLMGAALGLFRANRRVRAGSSS